MQDANAEMVQFNKFYYPKVWLEAIGYFHSIEVSGQMHCQSCLRVAIFRLNLCTSIECTGNTRSIAAF